MVVTATRSAEVHLPATSVKRQADFLLLQVEVSNVVNIAQYRDQVIQLFSGDVKKVTAALGGDYRVVVRGLDQPIRWVRDGTLGVIIFVPYAYDIVPTTISSYTPGRVGGGYDRDE